MCDDGCKYMTYTISTLELDGNTRRRHLSKFNNVHWDLRNSFAYKVVFVLFLPELNNYFFHLDPIKIII